MRRLGFFEVVENLDAGHVDVVFAPGPMRLAPRFRAEPMWREPRVLVVQADHPLAARESVSILETNDELFVSVANGPKDVIDWWIVDPRPDGSRAKRGPTADTVEGLLELVAAGAGVNIAGQSASKRYQRDELAFVPIDDIEEATIVLCSLTDSRNPMVAAFREQARHCLLWSRPPSTDQPRPWPLRPRAGAFEQTGQPVASRTHSRLRQRRSRCEGLEPVIAPRPHVKLRHSSRSPDAAGVGNVLIAEAIGRSDVDERGGSPARSVARAGAAYSETSGPPRRLPRRAVQPTSLSERFHIRSDAIWRTETLSLRSSSIGLIRSCPAG